MYCKEYSNLIPNMDSYTWQVSSMITISLKTSYVAHSWIKSSMDFLISSIKRFLHNPVPPTFLSSCSPSHLGSLNRQPVGVYRGLSFERPLECIHNILKGESTNCRSRDGVLGGGEDAVQKGGCVASIPPFNGLGGGLCRCWQNISKFLSIFLLHGSIGYRFRVINPFWKLNPIYSKFFLSLFGCIRSLPSKICFKLLQIL